jgi:hypothetical protein
MRDARRCCRPAIDRDAIDFETLREREFDGPSRLDNDSRCTAQLARRGIDTDADVVANRRRSGYTRRG